MIKKRHIDKQRGLNTSWRFRELADRLGVKAVYVPLKVPSFAERQRIHDEFGEIVRPIFLKGLYAFYKEELEQFLEPKMVDSFQMGWTPPCWSVHHLVPRSLGGQNLSLEAMEEIKQINSKDEVLVQDLENYLLGKDTEGISFAEQKKRFDRLFSNLALVEGQDHEEIHAVNNWYLQYVTKGETSLPNVDVLVLQTEKPYIVPEELQGKIRPDFYIEKEPVSSFEIPEELEKKMWEEKGIKPPKSDPRKQLKTKGETQEENLPMDIDETWRRLTVKGIGFKIDLSSKKNDESFQVSDSLAVGAKKAFLSKLPGFFKDRMHSFSEKDKGWLRNGSLPEGYAVFFDKFETNGGAGVFAVFKEKETENLSMHKIRKKLEFFAEDKKSFSALFKGFFLTDKETAEEIEAVLSDLEKQTGVKYTAFHKDGEVIVLNNEPKRENNNLWKEKKKSAYGKKADMYRFSKKGKGRS